MLIAIAALPSAAAAPDGRRLHSDTACYAITAPGDRVIGATWQSLRRGRVGGRAVWRIVVHQRLSDGSFDLRDALLLDERTLRPLKLTTTHGGAPLAELTYAPDRVTGFTVARNGERRNIDQALPGPVWDGDLYGPTFASLPLKAGARFAVPFFQYDRGLGTFTVVVKGSEVVDTPAGRITAWVLDAGPSATERLDYLIAKRTRRELGYRAPQGGQRLGGDCTGLR